MEVVEDEDDWLRERGRAKERCCCLEEAEARSFGVAGRRWRKLTVELVQLWKDLSEVRRALAELPAERLGVAISDVRTHRLYPRPVGGCATGLPTATDEHL